MSKPLKPKRGTTAENDAYLGEAYEVTLDTETHRLRTHDGVTAGGFPHALKADADAALAAADAAQSTADNAADASIVSASIDGLDLVLTYGNGTTSRVQLPAGKSVGDLWLGFDPESKPANVQLYAGQELSRSAYESHWGIVNGSRTVLSEADWQAAVAADGFCPFYSSGNGSTTYRMPLVKGVHPEFVAALASAGQFKAAGLPNITGNLAPGATSYGSIASGRGGAFYDIATGWNGISVTPTSIVGDKGSVVFDASRSNPIYGNSNTVQPPSLTFLMGEYVVGSVATIGEADATSLLASVTQLESEVSGLSSSKIGRTAADKAEVVGWGMPDYSAAVTLSDKVEFVAPTCGYVFFYLGNPKNAPGNYFYINGTSHYLNGTTGANTYNTGWFALSPGDTFMVNASGGAILFYFYPCIGL